MLICWLTLVPQPHLSVSNWHLLSQGIQHLEQPVQVKVANGNTLPWTHELSDQVWGVQGHTFVTTFKIISLGSYDIILGMDWLQQFSPMQVHWQDKGLQFKKGDQLITLKGITAEAIAGPPLSVNHLAALLKDDAILYQV